MRKKVTIVGAGNTGATMALLLAMKGYADIVLQDIIEDMPQGKALDMLEAGPILGYDSQISGANDWNETKNSDIVLITSGVPRKPGMTRDDLLKVNMGIVKSVAENAIKASPNAIFVVFANPMDAMCHVVKDVTGLPKQRIIGQGGVLDTARFRTFIAQELGVSVEEVAAYVLGGHGDTMVPLTGYTTVAGQPVEHLIAKDRLEQIVQRAREGGAEIVRLLKTGSAFYAPAAATIEMVDAILMDRKRILPCATYLEGEFGISGLFVGVPVKLGAGGVEQVVELPLDASTKAALHKSADAVRELVEAMARIKAEAPA
ncbi:MAG TPA: malate dehydrogenase [Dehalococcoidia bacterium]|nr:malate dehydrogenase [Dehalococcoidia bacterium]